MPPKRKKKLLPKGFATLLSKGDRPTLQAVFEECDVNARGGHGKYTALAFDECPDELARWLVANGADLNAADTRGNTPLHTRARSRRGRVDVLLELGADVNAPGASIGTPLHAAADSKNVENASKLLAHGADVDARNRDGLTPLELALQCCSNIDLEDMAPLARLLLEAGAPDPRNGEVRRADREDVRVSSGRVREGVRRCRERRAGRAVFALRGPAGPAPKGPRRHVAHRGEGDAMAGSSTPSSGLSWCRRRAPPQPCRARSSASPAGSRKSWRATAGATGTRTSGRWLARSWSTSRRAHR